MIIVTGGAGFIGSNVARGLNRQGEDRLLLVDDLTDGTKHRNMNCLRFLDYLDRDMLFGELPKLGRIDAVFHLGACSSTTETDGKYMMQNNYTYSKRLLDWALVNKIPFLYASSAAVYGDGKTGFQENSQCEKPLNVYAFSKLAFDNHVRHLLPYSSSQVTGLRYFNVYGPQENHKGDMTSVAFKLFKQAENREDLKLFEGSDGFFRDFVYVDDCVNVNLHFFRIHRSGIFNCGTGDARSFADVAANAVRCLGYGSIVWVPMPTHLLEKYQKFTQADLSQLRNAGYTSPFISLEEGMNRYFKILKTQGGLYE